MLEILANQNSITTYFIVFLMMVLNGAVNFPSSQILYIFLGYLTTLGQYNIILLAVFGSFGNTIGNIFLYEIVRSNKNSLPKFFTNIDTSKKLHFQKLIERHGVFYIFVGKLIPAVKVFIPAVAGMTQIKRIYVYSVFLSASFIWAYALIQVGAFFGTNISITKWYSLIVFVFILLGYLYTYKKYPELFSSSSDNKNAK